MTWHWYCQMSGETPPSGQPTTVESPIRRGGLGGTLSSKFTTSLKDSRRVWVYVPGLLYWCLLWDCCLWCQTVCFTSSVSCSHKVSVIFCFVFKEPLYYCIELLWFPDWLCLVIVIICVYVCSHNLMLLVLFSYLHWKSMIMRWYCVNFTACFGSNLVVSIFSHWCVHCVYSTILWLFY